MQLTAPTSSRPGLERPEGSRAGVSFRDSGDGPRTQSGISPMSHSRAHLHSEQGVTPGASVWIRFRPPCRRSMVPLIALFVRRGLVQLSALASFLRFRPSPLLVRLNSDVVLTDPFLAKRFAALGDRFSRIRVRSADQGTWTPKFRRCANGQRRGRRRPGRMMLPSPVPIHYLMRSSNRATSRQDPEPFLVDALVQRPANEPRPERCLRSLRKATLMLKQIIRTAARIST